jgi:O-antigen ligase
MESRRKIKYVLFILLSILPIIFLLDFYGFSKWFEHTAYYYRFFGEIEQSKQLPRTNNWQLAFNGFFKYPLGGAKTRLTSPYAHNLWLDVGWRAGLIPLIPLLIFTCRYIISVWRINKKKYYPVFFRSVIICVCLGFLLSFSVEPVMEGLFNNFCLFCLFFGVSDSSKRDYYYILISSVF